MLTNCSLQLTSADGKTVTLTGSLGVVARGVDKLARLFPDAEIEKRPADVLNAEATLRALDGCDLVYDYIGCPPIRCTRIR